MAIQPFLYQGEALDRIAETRRDGKDRALVVMASGLGKTVTAALDARRWLRTHGGRLLYLCHQKDILEQARTTFEAVLGKRHTYGYFHGLEKERKKVHCLFASFQTMRERRNGFRPAEFRYIVVDESHHGPAPTYHPTLKYFKPKFLLGITATPERTDLQDIRGIYGAEVFSLHIVDALVRGLLTPVDYRLVTDELQNLEVLDTPVGKLSIKYLNKKLFVPRRDEVVARIIKRHMARIPNPRVMIFCPSIRYCERLARHLPDSFPIHSQLPAQEQRARLVAFRDGLVNTVLTVDKFNEGIDVPDANLVVFLRSTTSRMLFFQQLGRGLRKVPGKKRVRVLDFVGNCERLEMVHKLWLGVGEKLRQVRKEHKKRKEIPVLTVDIGRVRFTEVAKRALDVIEAIRGGYTKETLIKQLRTLAEELERTPGVNDVIKACKAGKCAHADTFRRYFGSFPTALEAAGLRVIHGRGYSKKQLLRQLGALAQKLGRTPTETDVNKANKAGECASAWKFWEFFGSFHAALKAAGLRHIGTTRKELIQQLKRLAKELRRTPRTKDLNEASKARKCASYTAFKNRFGSFNAALKAARLPITRKVGYTKKELIQQLKNLAREVRRRPTWSDVTEAHAAGKCATPPTFSRVFGSLRAATRVIK